MTQDICLDLLMFFRDIEAIDEEEERDHRRWEVKM